MGTKRQALATLTIVATGLASMPAVADEGQRWYATANVGLGMLSDDTLTYNDGSTAQSVNASYEASFAGGGTIGYRFGNRWSLEGELTYRRNELDPVDVPGLGSFTGGDFASLGFGLNALYRFDIGNSGNWSAYVGPGVVYLQEIDIDFDADGQQEVSFESDDTAFQVKFGTRYDFSSRWFAEAGATYLTASGVRMELPADSSQTIESDYNHWTISAGIGFRF